MDVKYIGSGIGVVIGWLLFLFIIFSYFLQVWEPENQQLKTVQFSIGSHSIPSCG